ncbi:acyl-CoA-binding protein [Flavobacterium gelidilacus]|uniref:acyl-CoA-binding protein n=1 Tax=Flavobacterium gelidilacus TaxID=206041 RepID=UPI000413A1EB|nr:acyl-CoA-binding protein [Flavobacterium gelidilacus]
MNSEELNILFDEAFENANKIEKESVPPNMQLVLYGLYKHATSTRPSLNIEASQDANDLKNAFKMNAWMQVNHLSIDDAKEQYITLINSLLKERKL